MQQDKERLKDLLNKRDLTDQERKERDALIVKALQDNARRLNGEVS